MKKRIFLIFAAITLLVMALGASLINAYAYQPEHLVNGLEQAQDCNARSAVLMDADTGTIVYEKEPNSRLQIASMVKIMTLNLIFEQIQNGSLHFDDEIIASENAASMGGSQAFLDTNGAYKAEELIKSIIVASANDSCVAMAEHIAGSVGAFVEQMNSRAAEWGMSDTYFVNCTGLPAPNQYSCAKDVAVMSKKLFAYADFFNFSKIWMFDFTHPTGRITQLSNTNKLVRFYEGCDGGKTGFTSEAKSCLSATAKRGDTRFICVVIGAENSKTRNLEVSKLLNYGFANFETKKFIAAGQEVSGEISVANGKSKSVIGVAEKDLFLFGKKGEYKDAKMECQIDECVAPIKRGDVIGKMNMLVGENIVASVNILASSAVEEKNYLDFVDDFAKNW